MSLKPTVFAIVVTLAGGVTAAAEHSVLCSPPFRPMSDLLGTICSEIDRPLIGPPHWHPTDGHPLNRHPVDGHPLAIDAGGETATPGTADSPTGSDR